MDKVKEFINTTYNLTDVVGDKLPILITDATTQAVVKDIAINMSKNIKGTISINGYIVSDSIESLNGSEIIDINSKVVINAPVPDGIIIDRATNVMESVDLHYANSTTDYVYEEGGGVLSEVVGTTTITGTTLSEPEINSLYSSVMTVDTIPDIRPTITHNTTNTTVLTMGTPNWIYKHSNGTLYYYHYDGNSTTYLYYSLNNGASWNILDSNDYSYKCVSPSGKITFVSGTTFYFVDGTASYSSIALYGRITNNDPTSSYTHASECNGWHFWIPSNGYTATLYGYNHVKDIAITITMNIAMNVSSAGGICVTYNSNVGKYYVFNWTGTTRYLHRIDTDIDLLTADGTGTGTKLSSSVNIGNVASYTHGGQWIPNTNKMLFVHSNSKAIMSVEFDDISPYYHNTVQIKAGPATASGCVLSNYFNPAPLTQHIDVYSDYLDTTATIQVRSTGIETTL